MSADSPDFCKKNTPVFLTKAESHPYFTSNYSEYRLLRACTTWKRDRDCACGARGLTGWLDRKPIVLTCTECGEREVIEKNLPEI
ncbi:MAG: hypothetical protein SFV32_12720 [Opitutaceae bacterium]|nr:hypothetical protein [Opitutaceae bacterium]